MNSYDLEQVIAHRPPMILLSRLKQYDNNQGICEVDISEQSPFYQQAIGGVASYIGIEYMAQAVAAFAGAKSLDQGEDIQIGFLLGSRKYEVFTDRFLNGNSYQVSVEELYKEDTGLSVFDCKISLGDELLAKAKVNVFQPENPEEFVKEQ